MILALDINIPTYLLTLQCMRETRFDVYRLNDGQDDISAAVSRRQRRPTSMVGMALNPLMATLKPERNGSLSSNTVIGTLWYSEEGPGRAVAPPRPLIAVPNVTAHPSTASVPTSYYSMLHYSCL